jgi:hypothetical protein
VFDKLSCFLSGQIIVKGDQPLLAGDEFASGDKCEANFSPTPSGQLLNFDC